jgi:hypothetical protein
MKWPKCKSEVITFFDIHAVCVLPYGHEFDGQKFHRAYDGMEWWLWEEDGERGMTVIE